MHILIKSLLSTSLAGDERPILTTFCMGNHAGGSWYFKHVFLCCHRSLSMQRNQFVNIWSIILIFGNLGWDGGSWYFKLVSYVVTDVYLCNETSL